MNVEGREIPDAWREDIVRKLDAVDYALVWHQDGYMLRFLVAPKPTGLHLVLHDSIGNVADILWPFEVPE